MRRRLSGSTRGARDRIVCMPDEFLVTCPYCGETIEISVEEDVRGSFVQDCEVCCNPWRVRVTGRRGERSVDVGRADGSE
jgi:cysteine-rich CPXCG protein